MVGDWSVLLVPSIIFLATLIRSAFGFGEALIAVSLLTLFIPVEVAAPLAVLVSITVAGIVVVQDWHMVHVGGAWRLVLATFFGVPLRLLLLTAAPERIVKAGLGVVIVSFSAYCLVRRHRFELKNDRLAWPFGFVAGVLGGAYGMNGPPLVIYGVWLEQLAPFNPDPNHYHHYRTGEDNADAHLKRQIMGREVGQDHRGVEVDAT
jgi:uncharacterized protein